MGEPPKDIPLISKAFMENPLIAISDRFRERQLDIGRGGKVSINQFFSGDAGLFLGFEYFFPKLKDFFKLNILFIYYYYYAEAFPSCSL